MPVLVLGWKAFFWAEMCMALSCNSTSEEDTFSMKTAGYCSERRDILCRVRAYKWRYQRFWNLPEEDIKVLTCPQISFQSVLCSAESFSLAKEMEGSQIFFFFFLTGKIHTFFCFHSTNYSCRTINITLWPLIQVVVSRELPKNIKGLRFIFEN